jgi:hypothetical protein
MKAVVLAGGKGTRLAPYQPFCIGQIKAEQKPFTTKTETRNFTLVFLRDFLSYYPVGRVQKVYGQSLTSTKMSNF